MNEFQFKIPDDLKEMIKDAHIGMFITYSSNVLTGLVEKEIGIQQGGHLLGVYHSSKDGDFNQWWNKLKKTKKV